MAPRRVSGVEFESLVAVVAKKRQCTCTDEFLCLHEGEMSEESRKMGRI